MSAGGPNREEAVHENKSTVNLSSQITGAHSGKSDRCTKLFTSISCQYAPFEDSGHLPPLLEDIFSQFCSLFLQFSYTCLSSRKWQVSCSGAGRWAISFGRSHFEASPHNLGHAPQKWCRIADVRLQLLIFDDFAS